MEASQALTVRSSSDLAQISELEQILIGEKEAPEVIDDPQQISREIVMQLLAAESDEELEQMGQAEGWRDLAGVPIELHGFRWRPSDFTEGSPVFFVIQGTRLDTGARVTLTTGSQNVLAQLVNMAKRNSLVGAVRMLQKAEKPTREGYYPLWLVTPPEVLASRKAPPESSS